jgi:hypothetical protein
VDLGEISKAIYVHLVVNANDFKTALTGGLWFEENTNDPAEVVYPYAVYSFYPGDADYDSADKWYDPIYVLTIYESGEFNHG